MSNMWRACVWTVLLGLAPAAVAGERVTIPALDGGLQLPGIWFPAATSERRPAVITLHGCGGMLNEQGEIGAGYVREASYFNSEGIHVLALDSFTPRGQKSICEIRNAERAVNETDRRADVFAAIQWLARQGQVDPSRIVVVGRSHGGQTVLRLV
ncbi:MAG: hypothetical protein FJX52_09130, partial [Alphaproteobacteria bacterium]|nr:hypothetical protein [Alphaproteobacteria bacterium]